MARAAAGGWIKCINILRGGRKGRERDRYTDIQKNPGAGREVKGTPHMVCTEHIVRAYIWTASGRK